MLLLQKYLFLFCNGTVYVFYFSSCFAFLLFFNVSTSEVFDGRGAIPAHVFSSQHQVYKCGVTEQSIPKSPDEQVKHGHD